MCGDDAVVIIGLGVIVLLVLWVINWVHETVGWGKVFGVIIGGTIGLAVIWGLIQGIGESLGNLTAGVRNEGIDWQGIDWRVAGWVALFFVLCFTGPFLELMGRISNHSPQKKPSPVQKPKPKPHNPKPSPVQKPKVTMSSQNSKYPSGKSSSTGRSRYNLPKAE
mgnify:CR=1 FL=1